MIGKKTKLIFRMIFVTLAVVFVNMFILSPRPAYAAELDTASKSMYYGLKQCYSDPSFGFNNTVRSDRWDGVLSLVDVFGSTIVYDGSNTVNFSCAGLAEWTGRVPSASAQGKPEELNPFFEGMGYSHSSIGNDKACYNINFSGNSGSSVQLCAEVDESGKIKSGTSITRTYFGDSKAIQADPAGGGDPTYDWHVTLDCKLGFGAVGAGGCNDVYYTPGQTTFQSVIDSIQANVERAQVTQGGQLAGGWRLSSVSQVEQAQEYTKGSNAMKVLEYLSGGTVTSMSQLKLNDDEKRNILRSILESSLVNLQYYGGSEDIACGGLTQEEVNQLQSGNEYALLNQNGRGCWVKGNQGQFAAYNFGTDFFDGTGYTFVEIVEEYNELLGQVEAEIRDADAELNENCRSQLQTQANDLLHGAQEIIRVARNQPDTIPAETVANARRVVREISAINDTWWTTDAAGTHVCITLPTLDGGETERDPNGPSYTPPTSTGSNSSINVGEDNTDESGPIAGCLDADNALTWALCPALQVVGTAAEAFYDSIEENWLPVDANLLSPNSANGQQVYKAWGQFRDIANVAFAAVLLVVIFSQLTGFGITNYGIKKMLPNLIVVVVLVNLSFFICQFANDLTNILAGSVGSLLSDIGNVSSTLGTGEKIGRGIISALLNFVGIYGLGSAGVAIIGSAIANGQIVAYLIPVLIALVGALFGLFFFFLILAMRKAAIIGMIVISPLAFLCYALPNTKSIFDKWKKIFVALLVVYPVCQVLHGGGQAMSNLMITINGQGLLFYITALVLEIAPVFLIPGMVKNSLAALGNVGSKLSQMGDRWRSNATGKMKSSELAKQSKVGRDYVNATRKRRVGDLARKVNEKLRNSNGRVGKIARKVGDNAVVKGIGKSVNDATTRKRALAKAAYLKNERANADAANMAENMDQDMIDRKLAADRYKYQQELIDDAATNIQLGGGTYTDASGATQTIDTNDTDSLDQALDYYLSQYDATGDEKMLIQAEAITKLMFTVGGDGGMTKALKRLEQRNFDAAGNGTRTASFDAIAQYIARDGKWMATLKNQANGAFSMIGDAAKMNEPLKNLHAYHMSGQNKLRPEMVNDLSDHFHDSIESEIGSYDQQGNFQVNTNSVIFDLNNNSDEVKRAREMLLALDQTYTQTAQDERLSGKLKNETLDHMNNVHRAAYELRQAQATAQNQNFTEQYRNLERNEQKILKVPRMPEGWRRSSADERNNGHGDWVRVKDDGSVESLDPGEVARAVEYERQINEAEAKNSR